MFPLDDQCRGLSTPECNNVFAYVCVCACMFVFEPITTVALCTIHTISAKI